MKKKMSKIKNVLREEKEIPYYEDIQKRTFIQKIKKVRITLLMLLAYICPLNKLRVLFNKWRGVKIGEKVYIGMFCFLDNLYPEYIIIGDNASINTGCMILTHFAPMKRFEQIFKANVKPVIISEGAILAIRSTVLPGVTIGKNAVVSAGSVVDKNIPAYTLVRGNPAKKVSDFEIIMKNQS